MSSGQMRQRTCCEMPTINLKLLMKHEEDSKLRKNTSNREEQLTGQRVTIQIKE